MLGRSLARSSRCVDQPGQRHVEHLGELSQHGDGGKLLATFDLVQVVGRDTAQARHNLPRPVLGRASRVHPRTDHLGTLLVHPVIPSPEA